MKETCSSTSSVDPSKFHPTARGGRIADGVEWDGGDSMWEGGKLMGGLLNEVRVWDRFSATFDGRSCGLNRRVADPPLSGGLR